MSSSPTITNLYDIDDSPTESSHEPDNTPELRVVSQSQSPQPFDHLLNAVALRLEDINTPPRHEAITQLEAYVDDGMDYQVPQSCGNLIDPGESRAVVSPTRKNLLTSFETNNNHRKRDGSNLVDANKKAKKKKKIRVKPFTTICGFLRDSAIDDKQLELNSNKGNISMSSDIKSALTFWSNKRVASYAPFNGIKALANAPPPLMMNDHCLLLEDYMMLKPGDEVMCLINKSHPLVAKKKGSLKQVFEETMEHDPYQPVQYSRTVYFPLKLIVRSNINYDDFKDGNLEQSEIAKQCTKRYGGGITFWFMRKHYVEEDMDDTDSDDDGSPKYRIVFETR